ncbi:MAG TPA: NAD(P)-dependent oxidoreductase, partial [Verrucomicrobiae bacterium]|nr:NAD(P)-dependent oxidoreductase [Verrucomicrobiae bacterium]
KFSARVAAAEKPLLKINPSGYVETQGEFARRVAREAKARTGWNCELKLAKQEDFSEPLKRINTEPAAALAPDWNERAAWDKFVQFYAA